MGPSLKGLVGCPRPAIGRDRFPSARSRELIRLFGPKPARTLAGDE